MLLHGKARAKRRDGAWYEDSMAELNDPQHAAVEHVEGPLLVFAGAGSGKTRVITYRVANLLANHGVPPYRILAVTFTNKAAGEMKSRLVGLAGPEIVGDLWVGTFHSVCARILRRYHDEVGLGRHYVIYDDSDQKAVVARVMKALDLDDKEYPPKLVVSRLHRMKREGLRPEEVVATPVFDDVHVEIYSRYQAALRTANAVDFEDLIVHVMRIAEDPASAAGDELRRRFRHVLVDEFQDTNRTQYRLVRALAAREQNLCVVGDDDQSIYRWRGADVRNIRGFKKDFPGAVVVKLEQNYRSTGNIVAAALGVIEPAHEREPKRLWTSAPAGDPVTIRAVRDERAEAAFVVETIRGERRRDVALSDVAVFYRIHAQSRVLEEALRAENVPYQIVGGTRFFDRAEVKDCLSYLKLIDNPKSDQDLLRVINSPPRGIGQKTVARLIDVAAMHGTAIYESLAAAGSSGGLAAGTVKKVDAFRQMIESLRDEAMRLGPSELASRTLDVTHYRSTLREQDTAESDARLENLAELVGSVAEYEDDAREAGETPSLGGYLERVSLVADVDALKDVPAVSLMTVHSAKGLEFTTVILTGMEEEVFPYRGLDASEIEELDEERRLAYVALTRARERLLITHASSRMLFGQTRYQVPSRFLQDLPPENVVREGSGFAPGPFHAARGTPDRSPAPRYLPGERYVERDTEGESSGEEGVVVRPGDEVLHRRFGRGVVERVDVATGPTVTARFPGFGVRKILAQYLEPG